MARVGGDVLLGVMHGDALVGAPELELVGVMRRGGEAGDAGGDDVGAGGDVGQVDALAIDGEGGDVEVGAAAPTVAGALDGVAVAADERAGRVERAGQLGDEGDERVAGVGAVVVRPAPGGGVGAGLRDGVLPRLG